MMRNVLTCVLALATSVLARAAEDEIRMRPNGRLTGTVRSVSPTEVTIETIGGDSRQVPVAEIESIAYAAEPPQMKLIRAAIAGGNFDNALASLEKLDPSVINREEVKQDVQYYRALCKARLALRGSGDIREAGKQMIGFVDGNKNSYHSLAATEVLGDLLVAVGAYDKALERYDAVAKSSSPEAALRAGNAQGRLLTAQKKFAEAQAAYDRVLSAAAAVKGAGGERERLSATLGKALCLAESGQFDPAVKMVEEVIAQAPAEDAELNARAYVALGNCLRRKPDATKDALLAFLHVDVLYSSNREAHAEALSNLAKLWNEVGQPERSAQAAQTLKEQYAQSIWAK